jgi:hypothetical protein
MRGMPNHALLRRNSRQLVQEGMRSASTARRTRSSTSSPGEGGFRVALIGRVSTCRQPELAAGQTLGHFGYSRNLTLAGDAGRARSYAHKLGGDDADIVVWPCLQGSSVFAQASTRLRRSFERELSGSCLAFAEVDPLAPWAVCAEGRGEQGVNDRSSRRHAHAERRRTG